MAVEKFIPIVDEEKAAAEQLSTDEAASCAAKEPYALMVLGDSMEPEFNEGEIIIISPDGIPHDGAYVVAWHNEEYIFRQFVLRDEQWYLHPLNPAYEPVAVSGPEVVHGVIIQKQGRGGRRDRKFYDRAEA